MTVESRPVPEPGDHELTLTFDPAGRGTTGRVRARLAGRVLHADRLDLAPNVQPLRADDLLAEQGGETSATVARRVLLARQVGAARWGTATNADASPAMVRRTAQHSALRLLAAAVEANEIRSNTPAWRSAARVSPPPATDSSLPASVRSATVLATSLVPASNGGISKAPSGPFQTSVAASLMAAWMRSMDCEPMSRIMRSAGMASIP